MCETIVLRENAMLKARPDLIKEWDFDKNDELGLNVYEVTKASGKKVWWKCDGCRESYDMVINKRVSGRGCHYCSNKKVLIGFNDLWTTNPETAKLLANREDGYKYTHGSKQKVDWKCDVCGELLKNKAISQVRVKGLSCPVCSDGVSFPEKFVYHILRGNNVNFEYQKKFEWSNNKLYDFYIESLSCVIEVHGEQHKKGEFKSFKRDEKLNDFNKRKMAKENGIEHYVEIDAFESTSDYISKSIMSLNLDVDIKNVLTYDFKKAEEKARESIMKETWDLWNRGLAINEIVEKVGLTRPTVRKYLQVGVELCKCDYTTQKSKDRGHILDRKKRATKVAQINKDMSFVKEWNSIRDVLDYFSSIGKNPSSAMIHKCCRGEVKTHLGFKWSYA